MNPKAEFYFSKEKTWHEEVEKLRMIILSCDLAEELKWGCPCYTLNKKNVVLIHRFKAYCALLFFKGALLTDTDSILIQQTENVQAARQIRFTDAKQIVEMEPILKRYLHAAIEAEKSGLTVDYKKDSETELPWELQNAFEENPALQVAFNALTPGRQRAYSLYFSAPKQSKTSELRIEKSTQRILDGKGLND